MTNENISYIILNGIKYIVVYNQNGFDVYREENNNLTPISNAEREKLNTVLKVKQNGVWNSETLTNIVYQSNNNLELYPSLEVLERLESFVPKECKDIFYQKLSTVKIIYNNSLENNLPNGSYLPAENRITINVEKIRTGALSKNPK